MSENHKIKSRAIPEIFHAYKKACINQYSFDALGYKYFNENIDRFSGLPRPAKWLGSEKLKFFLGNFSSILNITWRFFFAYVYFFAISLRYIFASKGKNLHGNSKKYADNLLLGTGPRSIFVFNSALDSDEKKYCLSVPWADIFGDLQNSKFIEIKLLDIISKKDIFKAFCFACKAHAITSSERNISFQTYIGVNWFLVYLAICKLNPKKIFTAEHHDRWAILLDFIAENKSGDDKFLFAIVQHGLEHESTYLELQKTRYGAGVGLPYKIKNIDVVYAYNKDQFEIIRGNIVNSNKKLNVNYFKVKLFLHDIGSPKKKKIMFVGHPFCYDLQLFIYSKLSSIFDFEFYYKPHPTTRISEGMRNAGWLVINDKDTFPKVDFLISYPSTLVTEYKEFNINSFVHALNEEKDEFSSISEDIINSIGFNIISINQG